MAGIPPGDIYNAGGTIFQIGWAPLPVTANRGLPTSPNTNLRQWIISLEYVSASGSETRASISFRITRLNTIRLPSFVTIE